MNKCLISHPEIKIDCIVVKKENVQEHIRRDPNKLYNSIAYYFKLTHYPVQS